MSPLFYLYFLPLLVSSVTFLPLFYLSFLHISPLSPFFVSFLFLIHCTSPLSLRSRFSLLFFLLYPLSVFPFYFPPPFFISSIPRHIAYPFPVLSPFLDPSSSTSISSPTNLPLLLLAYTSPFLPSPFSNTATQLYASYISRFPYILRPICRCVHVFSVCSLIRTLHVLII